MTTVHSSPPLAQENIETEEANSGDKQPVSQSIANLDSIIDVNELVKLFEGLNQADGDGSDSD